MALNPEFTVKESRQNKAGDQAHHTRVSWMPRKYEEGDLYQSNGCRLFGDRAWGYATPTVWNLMDNERPDS